MGKIILKLRTGDFGQGLPARFDRTEHVMNFDVAQDGGLDPAVGEIEALAIDLVFSGKSFFLILSSAFVYAMIASVAMLNLSGWESNGLGIAVWCQAIYDRTSGIAEAEQLSHFVEGLAGGVVTRVADILVGPSFILLRG